MPDKSTMRSAKKGSPSRMRFSVQCLVAGFLLLSIDPAFPQSSPTATPLESIVTLYLDVDAESASVKDVIKSGLLKRLRQFSEVEIEGERDAALCAIFINVMEWPPEGYAISVVYTERSLFSVILSTDWRNQARDRGNEAEQKEAEDLVKEIFKTKAFQIQDLYGCSEARLGHTLDKIVASIDSTIIEPMRQFYQRTYGNHTKKEERPKTETSPDEN